MARQATHFDSNGSHQAAIYMYRQAAEYLHRATVLGLSSPAVLDRIQQYKNRADVLESNGENLPCQSSFYELTAFNNWLILSILALIHYLLKWKRLLQWLKVTGENNLVLSWWIKQLYDFELISILFNSCFEGVWYICVICSWPDHVLNSYLPDSTLPEKGCSSFNQYMSKARTPHFTHLYPPYARGGSNHSLSVEKPFGLSKAWTPVSQNARQCAYPLHHESSVCITWLYLVMCFWIVCVFVPQSVKVTFTVIQRSGLVALPFQCISMKTMFLDIRQALCLYFLSISSSCFIFINTFFHLTVCS